jgi:uncharacterized protein YgiM (DUF1202 family)
LAPAILLVLAARAAAGTTAYVTDELVLGVYAGQNGQGQRLATLHSGATLETLGVNGEFTQVRLSDGTSGWVKSSYLTTQEPATVRLKQLQDELDRNRATTPALAEAAARSEVEQLKRELKDRQEAPTPGNSGAPVPGGPAPDSRAGAAAVPGVRAWVWWVPALLAALACGFWLGYATLARRVRHKFGGIKVY